MLDSMDPLPWYRRLFSSAPEPDLKTTLAKAGQGDADASVMFASGQGVPQNDTTALMWTRKAAEGGDAGAQFRLGSRYHRTSMDRLQMDSAECRIEAYKWFHLASAQGYKGSAAACERVALGMTREEVADGNQRMAAFVARRPATTLNDPSRTTTE